MRTGSISEIIQYFFENLDYQNEVNVAICQFFDVFDVEDAFKKDPSFSETTSDASLLFHEWLVFDFKLKNGKTVLQEFYETNPFGLNQTENDLYADLQINEHEMWYVISSKPGSVEIENSRNGEIHKVREYSAAPFLRPRDTIVGRIAKVDDRYEFVGGKVFSLDIEMSENIKRIFRKRRNKMTAQDTYKNYFAPNKNNGVKETGWWKAKNPIVSSREAKTKLERALRDCDIDSFVSVELIRKWVRGADINGKMLPIVTVLMGLLPENVSKKNMKNIMDASLIFQNLVPLKTLGNKSPITFREEDLSPRKNDDRPRITQDFIEPRGWVKYAEKAQRCMISNDFRKAIEIYNECFEYLLKNQIAIREPYRILANFGIAKIGMGDSDGMMLLGIAHVMNSKYSFARDQLKKYYKDHAYVIIGLARIKLDSRKKDRKDENDPAMRYVFWLRKMKIDYSKHKPRPTTVTKWKSK